MKAKVKYESLLHARDRAIKAENDRKDAEMARRRSISFEIDTQCNSAKAIINEIHKSLTALYNVGIIHPKYRNITAISSIYDYLSTCRTYSLVLNGTDQGAYNIYENDVRNNKVIDVMQVGFRGLSAQLSSIQANQNRLYNAVTESNNALQSISLDIVSMSSAVSSNTQALEKSNYYARETENNTRILVDLNRDVWGDLRNLNGVLVNENPRRR